MLVIENLQQRWIESRTPVPEAGLQQRLRASGWGDRDHRVPASVVAADADLDRATGGQWIPCSRITEAQ